VRGLSPYPAAWTELVLPDGTRQVLKIYETEKIFASHTLPVGTVDTDHKQVLRIAVADGFVELKSVQLAGKKRMAVDDFLRGYRMAEGAKVE
jgi:methionyl-tRNA formyltransferase